MGFKRKFEIGDKVKVIKTNDPRYNQIGKITYYSYSYSGKGIYSVIFEDSTSNYYSNNLEKVEDSSNTNTKSNKLSISDLKPGMKVRIRPDLKKGCDNYIYITDSMVALRGTVQTIEKVNKDYILLTNSERAWNIDYFSEIVEEPKEETKASEKIEFPLKVGQVVTLLDGKKYQVIKNNTSRITCSLCSLGKAKCGEDKCYISHINGKTSCNFVIPAGHYFKLCKDQKTEDDSSKPINSIEKSSVKEIGIITKVNFTLTDFKSEKLEHSKFTIL